MTETTTLVCPHVLINERPVKRLIHHGDGTWQATCGEQDHTADCSDFRVVGINHIFERQPDLTGLETLREDNIAEWSDGSWAVSAFDESAAE